jgi:arylsulfatase A-like enzyme
MSIGLVIYTSLNRQQGLNIILITIDSLRSDHLGCYGYKRNTSPNIDKLVEEGVMFTQAISQASWTPQSLTSLLTATYPSTHKIYDFGSVLYEELITLPGILKKKRYTTVAVSAGLIKRFPGFEREFDNFFDMDEKIGDSIENLIRWIGHFKHKKFFAWVHFFSAHSPYKPPYPFNEMFKEKSNKTSKHIPIGNGKEPNIIPNWVAIDRITDVNYYISQYDGAIAYTDFYIGKLLDKLKILGLDKDTLIILTSDHGESIGEHDYYFQHGFLYDQLLKAPLIIKGPGITKGKVINKQVKLIDIMPTILAFLKIKVNNKIEGVDLLPLIYDDNNYTGNEYVFSETFDCDKLNLKSIRTPEWKLIYNIGLDKYELYNLKIDPEEITNLVDIDKEKFIFLKTKLEKWMNRPKPNIIPPTKPLDENTKRNLRYLGYLQ